MVRTNYLFMLLWILFFHNNTLAKELEYYVSQEPKYQALKKIGQGSYGIVYKKDDQHVIKVSTLKKVLKDGSTLLEVALLKALHHKALPEVISVDIYHGKANKYFEITLPYYSKPNKDNLTAIITDMASLLAYVHKLDITHRDIKSAHILARGNQHVLIDWGSAEIFAAAPTPWVGTTISYRDPAVLLKDLSNPKANDLWSLGVSFLEIAQGKSHMLAGHKKKEILGEIFSQKVDLDYAKIILEESEKNNQIYSEKIQKALSNQALSQHQDILKGLLKINSKTRLTAKELSEKSGEKNNIALALLPLPPKVFRAQEYQTKKMRHILYLWLYEINHSCLHAEDKILFEAMSIADGFMRKSNITRDKIQLAGLIAYYLSARFHVDMSISVSDLLYVSNNTYSKREFKSFTIKLLRDSDYNILFNHSLREFQKELYVDMSPQSRELAITMLLMLEIDEKTFEFSNKLKWQFVEELISNSMSYSSKQVMDELCDNFKGSSMSKHKEYNKICKSVSEFTPPN